MNSIDTIILGGGPAGLAAAYYAEKQKKNFVLFEASPETGGNCRTIKHGDFYFDTGAHRFHDSDKEITAEIKKIMGDDLCLIQVPSKIYFEGKYIDFPLSPYDLLKKIGVKKFFLAASQLLNKSFYKNALAKDFEKFALDTYGNYIAENFLLNYSEKLWGLPCNRLSPKISGKRLKGLDFKTFLIEGVFGKNAKTLHLDGAFYYPKKGFGDIFKRIEDTIPRDKIRKNSRVTGIVAKDKWIKSIIINDAEEIEARNFINTLPLSLTVKMFQPRVPAPVYELASSLKYRHIVLAVFMINKEKFSPNASIYFPEKDIPFTRIYEPKNRSLFLAPKDKTCIVVEIPCSMEDDFWNMEDEFLKKKISGILVSKNFLEEKEIEGFVKFKIPYAYPILETDFEMKATELLECMSDYKNMYFTGRSALFSYLHIHDLLKWGKDIVDKMDEDF